jgi:hypothetical protein
MLELHEDDFVVYVIFILLPQLKLSEELFLCPRGIIDVQ